MFMRGNLFKNMGLVRFCYLLVDINRAIADKSSLFVSVTVKILLFLFHIRPKSLTLQPDKETNNAKTDLFYRLCLAPCLVR